MITRNFLPASVTAIALTAAFVNIPAFAQEAIESERTAQAPAGEGGTTSAISDEKVEAFTVAYLEVRSVQQDYAARIGATQDVNAQQQLQAEASQKSSSGCRELSEHFG